MFFGCARTPDYSFVRIVDEATGRGVPLIEIKLPNEVSYWTDSAGVAAMREPAFERREVSLELSGHGFEPRSLKLIPKRGATAAFRMRRTMIAERLYRLTGEGIYRDSSLGRREDTPVLGQDTAVETLYRGKLFWIWGDTIGPDYWNFNVTAATSELPGRGGLDPAVGVEYRYFLTHDGRTKAMLPIGRKGLVWIEGLFTVRDPAGRERLLATYTVQQGLTPPDECGVATFNDTSEKFDRWFQYPCFKESHRSSHPIRYKDGGRHYWYLYPWLRVPDDWNSVQDVSLWEHRKAQLPATGQRASSVAWNEFRQRFILLLENTGEVWYAEALRPEGPYSPAVKIVHHNAYNFYNVVQHPAFAQEGGRLMYFEGTYTDSFSAAKQKTPRYNYNQIMYRLRLDDPRLSPAQR